ncbi:MAG: malto-oligosyltrehalose synthase [Desulfobulbus sp.]
MIPPLPLATYRLQFNSAFTFNDARRIVPYLHALGISHCYASPVLKARSGSSHGYDIVDHNALNPELGTSEEFLVFIETLHEFDMGLILDIVPNHMGIGGSDNVWWIDVLENGQASPFAIYFDIDWQPASKILRGKILLPILGDYYGKVLDRGEIEITFSEEQGSFTARYYEHLLPIDPKTYPYILDPAFFFLQENACNAAPLAARLNQLITDCRHLPGRQTTGRHRRAERGEKQAEIKRELALLCREKSVQDAIAYGLAFFNTPKTPGKGYDLLHRLLEKQAYRLAYWRVAADEINYRRFFNVNSLAGLCQEQTEVFAATHRFLFSLIEKGFVQGLRIDHPDGLFDPRGYYDRLKTGIRSHLPRTGIQEGSFYLVAEKILAIHEELPRDWPIHGTTGYEFANLVNGLFINPAGEKPLSQTYRFCTGESSEYAAMLYDAKKLIIKTHLASELTVLSNLLLRIAEQDRHTRDFTLTGLREALAEVVACFPVYRTYVTLGRVGAEDRRYVEWAVTAAKRRNPLVDSAIFDFVHSSLLQEGHFHSRRIQDMVSRFAMKFQQYTAPVMAKAQEDTVFYRDCRLLSLNEVGGEPRSFRVSRAEYHQANTIRQEYWPQSMLTTSTHDSKRSEDVRARLNVLSEIPNLWQQQVKLWMRLNRRHTRRLNGHATPSRNDEYHLYQTLLGTWPLFFPEGQELDRYRERIDAYMLKAVREAKVHTSWLNPNLAFEEALASFISALLQPKPDNRFLASLAEFCKKVNRLGMLNSLSQVLLKLTAPGVPDIYQGNELWNFSLVDPDNRRPVDFSHAQKLLDDLAITFPEGAPAEPGLDTLLATLTDGRAKLFITSRTLQFRHKHPDLFLEGAYETLPLSGKGERHLCVSARTLTGQRLIVIAPRFFASLLPDINAPYSKIADTVWAQTYFCLPENALTETYHNIFTGEKHYPIRQEGQVVLMVAPLLRAFPVALLYSSREG